MSGRRLIAPSDSISRFKLRVKSQLGVTGQYSESKPSILDFLFLSVCGVAGSTAGTNSVSAAAAESHMSQRRSGLFAQV